MTAQQNYFNSLVEKTTTKLSGQEILLASLSGETTDFVRFNDNNVRQAGNIVQQTITLRLISNQRHAVIDVTLTNNAETDRALCEHALVSLREQISVVSQDPYLLFNTEPNSTEQIEANRLPDATEAMAKIRERGNGRDLVGVLAQGEHWNGFANSLGQRNWSQNASFNFDWCFYLQADKAAKNNYAGYSWDDQAFAEKVAWSDQQVEALKRTPKTLTPGEYRAYLAPSALSEVLQLWNYGGAFAAQAHQTKQSALLQMVTDGRDLSNKVTMREATKGASAPNFESNGFVRPDAVDLIVNGKYANTLVSPRSAGEFGFTTNGANNWEVTESLSLEPGGLEAANTVESVDTGLYVGNLWYTNWSDQGACRVTGMTRFATFWVEGGEIVAPVNVMRFDDTAYRMFGDNLVDLTSNADVLLDSMSYYQRSRMSMTLPGALVNDMRFVL